MAKAQQRKQAKQTRAKTNPNGRNKIAENSRATTFAQKSKEAALKHNQQAKLEEKNFCTPAHQSTNHSSKRPPAKCNRHQRREHSTFDKLPCDPPSK